MYTNRKHVRDIPVKVRLNELEAEVLERIAAVKQKQPATAAYEILIEALEMWEKRTQSVMAA